MPRRFRSRLPRTIRIGPLWRRRPAQALVLLLLVLLILLGRGGSTGGDDHQRYHQREFTVVHVADGDTLDVAAPDGRAAVTRIRLWGVDTPEVHGIAGGPMYYGPEASAFAERVLLHRSVRVQLAPARTRDRYDRLLAYVILQDTGQVFNEMLLAEGWAYADWRFAHPLSGQYQALERRAREQGRGLWREVRPDQMPAWRQRGQKTGEGDDHGPG